MGKGNVIRKISEHVSGMDAARVLSRLLGVDGGPGSGNFGHKGRPGLVGGSGPGGGAQYRGGREDIGYFSSRKDWLNGLKGEEQSAASKLMEKAKRRIRNFEAISKGADPEVLKGLERNSGWKPGITPEEATIQDIMHPEDGNNLIQYMQGARNWNKYRDKLIKENLSSKEKELLEELESRDDIYEQLDETSRMYFDRANNMLLAKAMGVDIPTDHIDKSYDDFITVAIANEKKAKEKEKPEEKEPEPVENKDWLYADGVESWQKQDVLNAMYVVAPASFPNSQTGKYDMDEVERHIQSYLVKCLAEKKEGCIGHVREYTRRKQRILGKNAEAELASGNSPVLTEAQNNYARALLTAAMGPLPYGETIENVADIAESYLMDNKEISDMDKAYYLGLKMRVLGLTDRPPEEDLLEQCYGEFSRTWLPQVIQRIKDDQKKTDRQRAKEDIDAKYDQAKAENKIVISGDSMSEAVEKLRKKSGPYSEAEFKAVGDVVFPELEKEMKSRDDRMKTLREEKEKAWREFLEGSRVPGETMEAYEARKKELHKAYTEKQDAYYKVLNESPIKGILSRIRKTGLDDKEGFKKHFPGRSPAKKVVQAAYQDYPTEWIQASLQYGEVFTSKARRGCYSGDIEIVLSGTGSREEEVATHELGHRFESVIPGIKEAEKEFYERRTKGEETESLRKLTGIRGYEEYEVTRKDKFTNPYIGKYYSDGKYYEVVSMGFQYAFRDTKELIKDPDFARTILGILAVG